MDQNARERYRQSLDLFDRLCDLTFEERTRFLDEECADKPELRREVESLLAHDSDTIEADCGLSHENLLDALVSMLCCTSNEIERRSVRDPEAPD